MWPRVGSGGLTRSIISSRSCCSSAESTSLRVETWCCASTARHGMSRSVRISEVPAHRVQILDDIHQPLHAADPFRRYAADVIVLCREPVARLGFVAADERVEA